METVFSWPQRNDGSNPNEDGYLFGTAGQPKGMMQMVEISQLSLLQSQRYVLLQLYNIDEYHRVFLNEHMASYPRMASDKLNQKWLLK